MTDFIKLEKEKLFERSRSVFVLPYPYAKGHFRIYENGASVFISLDDSVFIKAASEWNMIELSDACNTDEAICIHTYAELTQDTLERKALPNDNEKLVLRLLMEEDRYCADIAAQLLSRIFPEYKRQKHDMWYLRAAFRKLFALYNDFFTKKL